MAGVYCDRCQTTVLLELDQRSCSNCGAVLVVRAPKPPPPPPTGGRRTGPRTPPKAAARKPAATRR